DLHDEHHRVADLHARVELAERVDRRGHQDRAIHQRARAALDGVLRLSCLRRGCGHRVERESRARLSSRTFTPGSPSTPSDRPSVWSSISFWTCARGRWRTAAMRCAWIAALAGEICGSMPEAELVTASTGTWAAVRPRS